MFNMDTTKYIEIPFLDHGRNFDGCDCYGLVRLIYKEEFNQKLPLFFEYSDSNSREEIQELIDVNKPLLNAKQLEEPTYGCIVVLNMRGFATHMGVYIGNNMIIHILKGANSLCERLNSPRLKSRLEGYYEIRSNTSSCVPAST